MKQLVIKYYICNQIFKYGKHPNGVVRQSANMEQKKHCNKHVG